MDLYITSDDIEGIAIWRPFKIEHYVVGMVPKELKTRMRTIRKSCFSDQIFYERNGVFSEEVVSFFENKHANFPHWELYIIGVNPIHQGKGYGSKLIRTKLAEIDEQNLPCYLHTENERNVKLYEHFGFELVDHTNIPSSELKSWAMIRKKKK